MNIAFNALRSTAYAIVTSPYVFILIIFAISFYRQNKKVVMVQKMIIGERLNSPFELTISEIIFGLIAGLIGSIILGYLGVSFSENTSIELIFILSIFLMLISPRFICFSYSGAILGFISILLEIMKGMYNVEITQLEFLRIDIVALMTLVAVLHFIEGILVILDGSKGSIPVFTKKNNKIIGGFALKRYWAIPVAVALIVNSNFYNIDSVISIVNWNTFLNPTTSYSSIKNAAILLMPFYGVIGYSAVTFTKTKKEKSFSSGAMIIGYSILLFVFARLAVLNIFFKLFVVLFAPLAHEGFLYIQRYMEVNKEPKYVSNEDGIMILEVAPNSPASQMGIKSGDMILEVNHRKIFKEDDILKTIREASNIAWFKIKRAAGNLEEIRYSNKSNSKRLGIVFVPTNVPEDNMVINVDQSKFSDILEKLKNKKD
ncbi:cell division topological determinant MinJ [Clostridium homopropionicum DSM 5847]|uniref:Cell division topological determinant MinJ n=1 Tax=Clostridium homopropionicum DSM 5847 TaxID=1121318 RepID=A0A0L6Z9G1_9CLOT|nr:PDZ domain-containing protein [Clostridium homopropionicum]KOA19611.1 cell division topological determinant MinJ [Clostridium homopropionicum DSM 5847]SFF81779.1 PDZ domain-containing protein [Clostridium homopropionicum]